MILAPLAPQYPIGHVFSVSTGAQIRIQLTGSDLCFISGRLSPLGPCTYTDVYTYRQMPQHTQKCPYRTGKAKSLCPPWRLPGPDFSATATPAGRGLKGFSADDIGLQGSEFRGWIFRALCSKSILRMLFDHSALKIQSLNSEILGPWVQGRRVQVLARRLVV